MNTPELIVDLSPSEVFVFGSNVNGYHGGGAAAAAMRHFGAQWGVGEGMQGQCYAIPTMEGLPALTAAVERFLVYAAQHPELTFLVTKIGTGIAGHSTGDVAPTLANRTPNVIIPAEFEQHLAGAE